MQVAFRRRFHAPAAAAELDCQSRNAQEQQCRYNAHPTIRNPVKQQQRKTQHCKNGEDVAAVKALVEQPNGE